MRGLNGCNIDLPQRVEARKRPQLLVYGASEVVEEEVMPRCSSLGRWLLVNLSRKYVG